MQSRCSNALRQLINIYQLGRRVCELASLSLSLFSHSFSLGIYLEYNAIFLVILIDSIISLSRS